MLQTHPMAAADGDGSQSRLTMDSTPSMDSKEVEPRGAASRDGMAGHPGRPHIPVLDGCRSVDNYEKLNRIDEGTYGVVYRAREKSSGKICALKQVKLREQDDSSGFPLTALREVDTLLRLRHENIITVSEVAVGARSTQIYMVMEYMEHELKDLLEHLTPDEGLRQAEVKSLVVQLLSGVAYMHDRWIIHRDLKTSNLLFNNRGVLKICDFGLARQYSEPIDPMTRKVVTLWYRAPELLLGPEDYKYTTAIDMWACGCIVGEIIRRDPLFAEASEVEVLEKILDLVGTPNVNRQWPEFRSYVTAKGLKIRTRQPNWRSAAIGFPQAGIVSAVSCPLTHIGLDLMQGLLDLNPATRLTAKAALNHPWLTQEKPAPRERESMRQFVEGNNKLHDRRKRKNRSDNLEEEHDLKAQPHGAEGDSYVFGSESVNVEKYLRQLDKQREAETQYDWPDKIFSIFAMNTTDDPSREGDFLLLAETTSSPGIHIDYRTYRDGTKYFRFKTDDREDGAYWYERGNEENVNEIVGHINPFYHLLSPIKRDFYVGDDACENIADYIETHAKPGSPYGPYWVPHFIFEKALPGYKELMGEADRERRAMMRKRRN
ncbi:hypothetical protein FOZ63_003534 [Perkinsus olseni]|uniref:Cyclin-dependent kinase 2 homolog n=1 Tax=Perkinsus olseni TaxID=32597 RepID=A0A7J6R2P6_PEROL|nr:hypothetical protein FOZ63_003534 [Perkinsus olseni]